MSAKEYRDYAGECMGWAKSARTDEERVTFLDMAKTWLQAAAMAERQSSAGNGAKPPTRSVSSDPPHLQTQSLQSDP
jgi:hypothetical protein